jgi:hypothetical protein
VSGALFFAAAGAGLGYWLGWWPLIVVGLWFACNAIQLTAPGRYLRQWQEYRSMSIISGAMGVGVATGWLIR